MTSDTAAAAAEVTPPATAPPVSRRRTLARIADRALFPGGGAVLVPLTIGAACLAAAGVRALLTPDGRFVLVVVLLGLLVMVPVALAIMEELR